MEIFTKEKLVQRLKTIKEQGWICCARPGNDGGIGNTLEDLPGIRENNLPVANTNEWELKTQRSGTTSLTTLMHFEPSPRALRIVPSILLKQYGWAHQKAGTLYPQAEKSFRQTICCSLATDRGFRVVVDRQAEQVRISFDASLVATRHAAWLSAVKGGPGLGQLNPQPYWGFRDLDAKASSKLLNCFYVVADEKIDEHGRRCYNYAKIFMCHNFSFPRFLNALENGYVLVDFDARTGHNHGTKFRLRQEKLPELYAIVEEVV